MTAPYNTRHEPFTAPWHGFPSGKSTCSIRVFANSSLELIEYEVLQGGTSAKTRRPSFSFLITHEPTGRLALFDLGVPGNYLDYVPEEERAEHQEGFATKVDIELDELLKSEGVDPEKVDTIVISHYHWDHTGRPSSFPKAKVYVGLQDVLQIPALKGHSNIHSLTWSTPSPIASFERALDVFGDGSFLILSTPGHTPGHVAALVRTDEPSTSHPSGDYVLLGADCCHHTNLISQDPKHSHCQFALFKAPGGDEEFSYHDDLAEAGRSLERIRATGKKEEVFTVIAHDEKLWKKWGKGTVGPELKGWREKKFKP